MSDEATRHQQNLTHSRLLGYGDPTRPGVAQGLQWHALDQARKKEFEQASQPNQAPLSSNLGTNAVITLVALGGLAGFSQNLFNGNYWLAFTTLFGTVSVGHDLAYLMDNKDTSLKKCSTPWVLGAMAALYIGVSNIDNVGKAIHNSSRENSSAYSSDDRRDVELTKVFCVTATRLNVRSEPSVARGKASVRGTLPKGRELSSDGELVNGGWRRVNYYGILNAYVSDAHVRDCTPVKTPYERNTRRRAP